MECCVQKCDNTVVSKTTWRQRWCMDHGAYHGEELCTCSPLKWFPFPRDKNQREAWVELINRINWEPSRSQLVCSRHFKEQMPTIQNPLPTENLGYKLKESAKQKLLDDLRSLAEQEDSPGRSKRKRQPPKQGSDFVFELPKKKTRNASDLKQKASPQKGMSNQVKAKVISSKSPKNPVQKAVSVPVVKSAKTRVRKGVTVPEGLPVVIKQEPISEDLSNDADPEVTGTSSPHLNKNPEQVSISLFYSDPSDEPIKIKPKEKPALGSLSSEKVSCSGCKLRNCEIERLENKIKHLETYRDRWRQHFESIGGVLLDDEVSEISGPEHEWEQSKAAPIIIAPNINGGSSIIETERETISLSATDAEQQEDGDYQEQLEEPMDEEDGEEGGGGGGGEEAGCGNDCWEESVNFTEYIGNAAPTEDEFAQRPKAEPYSCIQIRLVRRLTAKEAWEFLCQPSELMPVSRPPYQPEGGTIYLWAKKGENQEDEEVGDWYNDGFKWRNNGSKVVKTDDGKVMLKRHYKPMSGSKGFMRYVFMLKGDEDHVLVQYVGKSSLYVPPPKMAPRRHTIRKRVDPDRPIPRLGPLIQPPEKDPLVNYPEGSRLLNVVESNNEQGALEYLVIPDLPEDDSPPDHPLPSPYFKERNEPMDTEDVLKILQSPDRVMVSVYPPHRPAPGTAYLLRRDTGNDDWSNDGFCWQSVGSTYPQIDGVAMERQFFVPQCGTRGFVRYVYSIQQEQKLVFVHYVGDSKHCKDLSVLQSNTQIPPKVLKMVETTHPSGEVEFSLLDQETDADSVAQPYFMFEGPLSIDENVHFLKDPDMSRVSSTPPFKPQGGSVYLWSNLGNPNLKDDWRCDGYPWKCNAVRLYKSEGQTIKKHYFKLIGKYKGFQKVCCHLVGDDSLVMTSYTGDSSGYVPKPHGNCKRQTKEHVRCKPSVIREVKQLCQTIGPKATCAELADKMVAVEAAVKPGVLRSRQQVYSHFGAMQRKLRTLHNQDAGQDDGVAAAAAVTPAAGGPGVVGEENVGVVIGEDALRSILENSDMWSHIDPGNVKFEFVAEVE